MEDNSRKEMVPLSENDLEEVSGGKPENEDAIACDPLNCMREQSADYLREIAN